MNWIIHVKIFPVVFIFFIFHVCIFHRKKIGKTFQLKWKSSQSEICETGIQILIRHAIKIIILVILII